MHEANDIEVKFSTKHLPFEYKWLESRLIINKIYTFILTIMYNKLTLFRNNVIFFLENGNVVYE